MAEKFLEIVFTKSVLEAQEHYFGKSQSAEALAQRDEPTEEEINFIRARDSFYIATVSESGWPYMQHRGGHAGFLQVVTPTSSHLQINVAIVSCFLLAISRWMTGSVFS